MSDTDRDARFMQLALAQRRNANAMDADTEPVEGAVLVKDETVISTGVTCRHSQSDPIRFAEMDCIANAGRRNDHATLTLYTTGSPNWLSVGTIVQFGIGTLVFAGEANTAPLSFLAGKDVALRSFPMSVVGGNDASCGAT